MDCGSDRTTSSLWHFTRGQQISAGIRPSFLSHTCGSSTTKQPSLGTGHLANKKIDQKILLSCQCFNDSGHHSRFCRRVTVGCCITGVRFFGHLVIIPDFCNVNLSTVTAGCCLPNLQQWNSTILQRGQRTGKSTDLLLSQDRPHQAEHWSSYL